MPTGTILVADDDAAIRTVLNQALSRAGYTVRLTSNATTLWRWVSSGDGDLVITDVMMPRMDGLTLAQRIKMDDKLSRIPVIMLTAKGGPKDVITGINAGARHYITKPFKKEELVAKVKKVLRLP